MGQPRRHIGYRPLGRVDNEQGAALIIVLLMLLLLIILGTTLFTSSVTELKVAGNYRNNLETFFAADAAVEFAMTYGRIYELIDRTSSSWPRPGMGTVLDDNYYPTAVTSPDPNYNQITISGTNIKAQVKVELVKDNLPPPVASGMGEDAALIKSGASGAFLTNIFSVSVIADGPNHARSDIEAGEARIVNQ